MKSAVEKLNPTQVKIVVDVPFAEFRSRRYHRPSPSGVISACRREIVVSFSGSDSLDRPDHIAGRYIRELAGYSFVIADRVRRVA